MVADDAPGTDIGEQRDAFSRMRPAVDDVAEEHGLVEWARVVQDRFERWQIRMYVSQEETSHRSASRFAPAAPSAPPNALSRSSCAMEGLSGPLPYVFANQRISVSFGI